MPIYKIKTTGEEKMRLVKAQSAPAAIAYCANQQFSAELVTSVEAAADLLEAGVKIETVGAVPAEPEPEPEPQQDGEPKVEAEDSVEVETGKGGKGAKPAKPGEDE